MDRKEVLEKVNNIFRDVLQAPAFQVVETMSAKDVDGWDSMTNMMIISKLEQEFGIKFKLREIIRMKNVGEMVDKIMEKAE